MEKLDFSTGWSFGRLGQAKLRPVLLPHDAMLAEHRTANAESGINGAWFEGSDYVYEKTFRIGPELQDRLLTLEFEGVYRKAEVWINGRQAAFRPYGYTNFYVFLTEHLEEGENTVRVIARNADQPNCRWYSGAGIYRPVHLWTAPPEHILMNGLTVRTQSTDPAAVEVRIRTSHPGTVQLQILDGDQVLFCGRTHSDGEAIVPISLPGASAWCPENPKLYTCLARFGEDQCRVSFGIRTLSWGQDGLLLNGRRVILRGACIHHDNGILGAACHKEAVERKVRLLMANGYNAIRSAHNPCSKALLDVCDRLGMLVMDEYIDHWYIHKNQYDYVEYFDEWWRRDLQDMVEKDFNHPCVIMYSTGNEVSETAQERGISLTKELTDWLHTLDGTRPVTCGINILFNFLNSIGFGMYSDDKAEKEARRAARNKARGKKAKKTTPVGSQFFNELTGLVGAEFMKYAAMLHGCDLRTRDAFANMDIAGYNYGICRYSHDLKHYPNRLILGSETFCSDAYRFWQQAQNEPRIIGDFVWAGMDYLGEVGVGSWEYRNYAPDYSHGVGWISAGSGRIDLTGKPLCEAAYTRVAFGLEAGPRIGVCPVDNTDSRHSPSAWKMSNALESWSWDGCEGKYAKIEVYARAHSVALLCNGTELGKKLLKNNCIARFRCRYQPGILEAVSYDADGQELGRCKLESASGAHLLRAEPEQQEAEAGKLCFIRLRYCDSQGITRPLDRGILKASVSGGTLEAFGSACPYYTGSYLDDSSDTYYGEALAVVRAGAGEQMEFSVTDGKLSATLQIPIRQEV